MHGDRLTVDFTGSDTRDNLAAYSTFGNTRGYVVAQIASMMDPAIPKNEGFFDSIDLIVPEGCCLNPPPNKSVAAGTHHPGTEVGEAIAKALEQVIPERCCPQIYKMGMPTVIFGTNPRTGQLFIDHSVDTFARLLRRGEGAGRLGRDERQLRQPDSRHRRDQREHLPGAPPGARLRHRHRRRGAVARLPGHALREADSRAVAGLHVRRRPQVPDARHRRRPARARRTSCDCAPARRASSWSRPLRSMSPTRPARATRTATAAAAAGAIRSSASRRRCSTTCSTSTSPSRRARRDYGVVLSGSLEALDLAIDQTATAALRAELRGQPDADAGC